MSSTVQWTYKPDIHKMLLDILTKEVLELKAIEDEHNPQPHLVLEPGVNYQLSERFGVDSSQSNRLGSSSKLLSFKSFCDAMDNKV